MFRLVASLFLIAFVVADWPAKADEPVRLPEMVITGTRQEEPALTVPALVDVLNERDLQYRRLSRTVPEALEEVPGVMVQKTSHGQGSPYLRGFTGFRTLFMIDGIRLNNSTFREGPNQYWNTVDPFTIRQLEVVKGPSSVLFGSDAIGGTVNALTRSREEFVAPFDWDRRVHYRYSSAEQSHVSRFELSANAGKTFGVLIGGTIKDFGNVIGGEKVGEQPKTGYRELDGDLKLEFHPAEHTRIVLAHQQVDQDNAWRTHRTVFASGWHGTSVGTDKKLVFDQDRTLTYLQVEREKIGGWLDGVKLSLSWQQQEEQEFRRRSNDKTNLQGFEVGTAGIGVQFQSPSSVGRWTYGVDYYHDEVDSFRRDFAANGSLEATRIQGPVADDASYDLLGVFVQNEIPAHDRLDLILGARFTHAAADANRVEDPVTKAPIALSDSWDALVGSARAMWHVDEKDHWKIFAGVSQGFRAPNLSDLTRLDVARSGELEVPSPGLEPEYFLTSEIGFKTQHDNFTAQAAYFFTDINDMIIRVPQDDPITPETDVVKRNAGDGYVHGIELGASWRFHPQLTAFGNFAWVNGRVTQFPTSASVKKDEPLDKMMPPTAHLGLRWDHPTKKYWAETILTMADDQEHLSSGDQRDTQRIPPGGTPGYAVASVRGGAQLGKHFTLTTALENLTNKDYRVHGSGLNEPGINFVIAVDGRF